jgi:hypothetical protein
LVPVPGQRTCCFIREFKLDVIYIGCLPIEVIREKGGLVSGGVTGGVLGAIAGAIVPGVSAKKGAALGAALGAGVGAVEHHKKTGRFLGRR